MVYTVGGRRAERRGGERTEGEMRGAERRREERTKGEESVLETCGTDKGACDSRNATPHVLAGVVSMATVALASARHMEFRRLPPQVGEAHGPACD